MLSNAKYVGCEVCAILSEGILKFLSDESCGVAREDVDELRIDFNLAATRRSLEVALLGTPIRLCFYASEGAFTDLTLCQVESRLTDLPSYSLADREPS
jgi:hypothetical protein